MRQPRTQQGQSWEVKFRKPAPNQPASDSTKGKQGKGSPMKDLEDRLGLAMRSNQK